MSDLKLHDVKYLQISTILSQEQKITVFQHFIYFLLSIKDSKDLDWLNGRRSQFKDAEASYSA